MRTGLGDEDRFIPARAGNTSMCCGSARSGTVHPRSRGEHSAIAQNLIALRGSSPLARGTRAVAVLGIFHGRFIPARAGNTARLSAPFSARTVHPRSRGEHQHPVGDRGHVPGSSPLARGTRPRRRRATLPGRFIPARAGNTSRASGTMRSRSVHPRSRGEHLRIVSAQEPVTGSSPLARGTQPHRRCDSDGGRFIPARAGNTRILEVGAVQVSVHPRSRGEHPPAPGTPRCRTGSSPLARGTPTPSRSGSPSGRFIPARAGNTLPSSRPSPSGSVHPRSRGEHESARTGAPSSYGSSPLARGTRPPHSRRGIASRFIPARAGNTRPGPTRSTPRSVHPRSRGEHDWRREEECNATGSSPLARGTLLCICRNRIARRFIPARAGNTKAGSAPLSLIPVHPRSRGEHTMVLRIVPSSAGSSPLARGTPEPRPAGVQRRRFIPARAGNTCPCRRSRSRRPVHPRSRGEHVLRAHHPRRRLGSSPLARGTQREGELHKRMHRFIPARAGNTLRPHSRSRLKAVHPRSRGEHRNAPISPDSAAGSSPLARGTLPGSGLVDAGRRFIPARAGNTPNQGKNPFTRPVHPRSRGEHGRPGAAKGPLGGSSPLARGTPGK